MTLDAHQHFWQYNPVRDAWIDDSMSILKRDFLPDDLKPYLDENGLFGCVAVQADQSEAETHFLLQLAENHDFIQSIVGWVDLQGNHIEERLTYFSQFKKISGFRHIVQAEKDPFFLQREKFCRGIAALEPFKFTYDILVYPHQLQSVLELVRQFPNQLFVIDHLGKPRIKDCYFQDWAILMEAISRHENVYCKVSGLVTEADWKRWKYEDFLPYLDLVTDGFGVERLMYGSDFPVCLLAASYHQVANLAKQYFQTFTAGEKALIFGETARQFYGIK